METKIKTEWMEERKVFLKTELDHGHITAEIKQYKDAYRGVVSVTYKNKDTSLELFKEYNEDSEEACKSAMETDILMVLDIIEYQGKK